MVITIVTSSIFSVGLVLLAVTGMAFIMILQKLSAWFNTGIIKRRLPFRWKIILPFAMLGLWVILGGSFIISQIVFENASERFSNQLMEGGKIATEWMVKEETNQLEALRFIAYTSGVAEAVRVKDAEKLRDLTFTITLNKQLEAVEFLDQNANLIFSMRHQAGGALEDYRFIRDGDDSFGQYSFIQNTLNAQTDRRGDKYAGLVSQDRETYFYIAAPLLDEQYNQVGTLLVGTTTKTLVAHLRDQTFARVTLYMPQGTPVASSFAEIAPLDTSAVGAVLSRQLSNSFTRTNHILETDFEELIIPWKARGIDLGVMGISYSKPIFIDPTIPTRVGMFVFVFAIFLLIILLGLFIANNLTRPLANLTRASQQISQGNLEVEVPLPATNDELTDLTGTFNNMVHTLNRANAQILETYDSTLVGWTLALELREKETALHNQRVAEVAVQLARAMGVQGEDLINVRRGALLHDIGKIGVPDAILNKPGPLTVEEFAVMKRHTTLTYEVLSNIEYLRPALVIPLCHHEKWDGSGYPQGLAGENIPMLARIFAVVDVWDAITSDRVYRKAMSYDEAVKIIKQGRGTHFDPQVVDTFLELLPEIVSVRAKVQSAAVQLQQEGAGAG